MDFEMAWREEFLGSGSIADQLFAGAEIPRGGGGIYDT